MRRDGGDDSFNLLTHKDGWKVKPSQSLIGVGDVKNRVETYSTIFCEEFNQRAEILGIPLRFPLKRGQREAGEDVYAASDSDEVEGFELTKKRVKKRRSKDGSDKKKKTPSPLPSKSDSAPQVEGVNGYRAGNAIARHTLIAAYFCRPCRPS